MTVGRLVRICIAAALTGLIAYFAWRSVPALVLLLLLPLVFRLASNRLEMFLIAFVYFVVFARDIPYAVSRFFPDWSPAVGYFILLADAAILAIPFLVINPNGSSRNRFIAATLAITLLFLPPFGILAWGHPLFVAGALYPGLAWIGICLAAMFFASMMSLEARPAQILSFILVVVSIGANLSHRDTRSPEGWAGVDTKYDGPFPGAPLDRARRATELASAVVGQLEHASYVVLPESVAGPWRPGLDHAFSRVMEGKVAETVLIGSQVPVEDGYLNALVSPQGKVIASSRIPMPLGDWRPGGAKANPFGSDLALVGDRVVAVSICFEDFILWPHRGLFNQTADLLVSAANDWSVSGRDAVRIQKTSAEALARIAGVPLVRSLNEG